MGWMEVRSTGRSAEPSAPSATAAVVSSHPEQGWSLLCNGVIVFDDLGALLPGSELIPAQR